MIEIWKPFPEFEDSYEVSSLGRFRSKARLVKARNGGKRLSIGKIIRTNTASKGYQKIRVFKDSKLYSKLAHRVIADVFLDNSNKYPQVNHLNGIKSDNRVSNLEWCNGSENEYHKLLSKYFIPTHRK